MTTPSAPRLLATVRAFRDRPRLTTALVFGIVVAIGLYGLPNGLRWTTRNILIWDAAALSYIVLMMRMMRGCGVNEIQARAAAQDAAIVHDQRRGGARPPHTHRVVDGRRGQQSAGRSPVQVQHVHRVAAQREAAGPGLLVLWRTAAERLSRKRVRGVPIDQNNHVIRARGQKPAVLRPPHDVHGFRMHR